MDKPRGLQWTFAKTLEDLDFADDIGLLSHYIKYIQEKSRRLSTVALQTGLEINTQKTMSMRVNTATNTLIQIAEQNIEDVESFTYLGSIISKTGDTGEDIISRIGKARHVFVTLKSVWNNRNILLKTKRTIFNYNVGFVLLYGSETWKHTKALFPIKNSGEEHNIDQFQRPSRSGNGGGLGTPYDGTQPASQDRHSTGTPKGSADEHA